MKTFFLFFFFFWRALVLVSLVLGLGLEHSCPWPRECLSSERLSLALASDFFCVLGLGLEPCVLDSTSAKHVSIAWIPGLAWVHGNEMANYLAKSGSKSKIHGPEPFITVSYLSCVSTVKHWSTDR